MSADTSQTVSPRIEPREESPDVLRAREMYLMRVHPGQQAAEDAVERIVEDAFLAITHLAFDRMAVPYAVHWATKQLTDCLFAAFSGPDAGATGGVDSWHADPVPPPVPMDARARGTLTVIQKPPPPREPTPIISDDLRKKRSGTFHGSHRKRRSTNAASETSLSRASSVVSSVTSSPTGSVSFADRRRFDEAERHSTQLTPPLSPQLSVATISPSRDSDHIEGMSNSSSRLPRALIKVPVVDEELAEDQRRLVERQKFVSAERERALQVEKRLEAVLQDGAAAHGNDRVVVDVLSGEVLVVKPVVNERNPKVSKRPEVVVRVQTSRGHDGTADSPQGKGSYRPRPRKLPPTLQDFFREDHGQQMVCSIAKPALGVAVRDADKVVPNHLPKEQPYGDGRVTMSEFTKLRVTASGRLNSSEGFRDYFPGKCFTPALSPIESFPPPQLATPPTPAVDSSFSGDALPLKEQLERLVADRLAVSHAKSAGKQLSLQPQSALHARKMAPHVLDPLLPPASVSPSRAPASLPRKRADLLVPLPGRTSPPPGASNVAVPTSPVGDVMDFVLLQKQKDAPHFKAGKAGTALAPATGVATVGMNTGRKEALRIIAEQNDIIHSRRPTRIVISPTADGEEGS